MSARTERSITTMPLCTHVLALAVLGWMAYVVVGHAPVVIAVCTVVLLVVIDRHDRERGQQVGRVEETTDEQ